MPTKFKVISLLVLFVTIFGAGSLMWLKQKFEQPLDVSSPQLLVVKKGQTAHSVINRLFENNVLTTPLIYKLILKINPELSVVKQGTYELSPGINGKQLFNMMVTGKEKQFTLSLVEGLTYAQWLEIIQNADYVTPLNDDKAWHLDLKPMPQGGSLEGWLLPDTYHYTANTSTEEIINRAYSHMHSFLQQQWHIRAIDLPYDNPYEALIMASIVEKETGVPEERSRIAGVFVNRIRQNMRLQTDPTVIYGMGDAFDGNIRKKDLRQATPYNTYVIKGLPPTPIAMPSKAAIIAALNPMETDELYFVAKGDGSHQFSTTLAEHNAAVRRYQLKKK